MANKDELIESIIPPDDAVINAEEENSAKQEDFDIYKIIGNPYKTAIGFPTLAELKRVNWGAFIFALAWWLICFYTNCVVQVTTEHIENRTYPMSQESDFHGRFHFYSESYELFDLGFAMFPRMPNLVADIFAFGLSFLTIVRFLLTKNRFIVFKRYTLLLGTVFLFRALTIVSTILPQPQRECFATATGNPFVDAFLILLVQKKTCTDMFFSGHATNMSFAALLWTNFSHVYPIIPLTPVDKFLFRGKPLVDNYGHLKRPTLVKILVWVVVAVGCFFVSSSRLHYLIDVIFGLFVSITVFKLYHHALSVACLKNTLISKFIRWFDSDSPEIELGKHLVELYPFLDADSKKSIIRKNSIDCSDGDEPTVVSVTGP